MCELTGGGAARPAHENSAHITCPFIFFFCVDILRLLPDHLLSYFLDANEGSNAPIPEGEAAASAIQQQKQPQQPQVDPTAGQQSCQSMSSVSHMDMASHASGTLKLQNNSSLENFVNTKARESSGALSIASGASSSGGHRVQFCDDGQHQQPAQNNPHKPIESPTSAANREYNAFIQNASSGSLQNGNPAGILKVPSQASTASLASSQSSLTNMAAALALGSGPNQVLSMQQKLQQSRAFQTVGGPNSHILSNTSPITPVNMMGSPSGQETMMLPPPPRFPNSGGIVVGQPSQPTNQQQQVIHSQQQQYLQQQQVIPQVVQSTNYATANQQQEPQSSPSNVQNQQPNFLPQMNPPAPAVNNSNQKVFPDPNSILSGILSQPQHQGSQQQGQQIQIGLQNGQSIPLTAVSAPNGSVYYQIDPTAGNIPSNIAANPASLRYFTKAINEVSKEDENKETCDPKVLAEKRAQRLARNRESARLSRRRKKDHLNNMGAKVKSLQRQLDDEVRNKIRSMEEGLNRHKTGHVNRWIAAVKSADDQDAQQTQQLRQQMATVVQKHGCNNPIRRAVIAHQYNALRQALLSSHNRYSVWMMMQSSSFFTEASRVRHLSGGASSGS